MMFVRSFCGAAPAGPFVARRAFAWVVALFWISPALFSLIRQVKGIRYSGTGSHATLAKKTCRHQASPAPPGRALNDGPTQPFFSLTKQGLCCIEIITASALYLNMAGIQHCVVRIKKIKKKEYFGTRTFGGPPPPLHADGWLSPPPTPPAARHLLFFGCVRPYGTASLLYFPDWFLSSFSLPCTKSVCRSLSAGDETVILDVPQVWLMMHLQCCTRTRRPIPLLCVVTCTSTIMILTASLVEDPPQLLIKYQRLVRATRYLPLCVYIGSAMCCSACLLFCSFSFSHGQATRSNRPLPCEADLAGLGR